MVLKNTLEMISIKQGSTTTAQVTFEATAIGSEQIRITFKGLSSNNPNKYGNRIYLWENIDNIIPWGDDQPIKNEAITELGPQGSIELHGLKLQDKSYIIAYCVGKDVYNICSTTIIPLGGQKSENLFQTSIQLISHETDSLNVSYEAPEGCAPKTSNHWIGLWEGRQAGYQTRANPVYQQIVDSDRSKANIGISYKLDRDTTYTVAYFVGGYKDSDPSKSLNTVMAATTTFST